MTQVLSSFQYIFPLVCFSCPCGRDHFSPLNMVFFCFFLFFIVLVTRYFFCVCMWCSSAKMILLSHFFTIWIVSVTHKKITRTAMRTQILRKLTSFHLFNRMFYEHHQYNRYGATTCLTLYFEKRSLKRTHWWVPVALGRCGFFALGNSHLISTIDIAGAYTGVSSFSIMVRV